MTAQFLHKKKDSSLWYYRRRFPQDVAKVKGKATYLRSLETTIKRDAERLSRILSVQFDAICEEARREHLFQREVVQETLQGAEPERIDSAAGAGSQRTPESVLAQVPVLIRLAATRVVEEQQRDPQGWLDTIRRWRDLYSSALKSPLPSPGPQTAIEAQAILNGIDMAVQGQPLPQESARQSSAIHGAVLQPILSQAGNESAAETWTGLYDRALCEYKHKVTPGRYRQAKSSFSMVKVTGCTEFEIQEGLREWCNVRLLEVKPRTVKTQLDCMLSALRCVLPKLSSPTVRELKGVMQPNVNDRQSMPVQEIRAAILAFRDRPSPVKVRNDYGGGASQFDAVAVEVLAVLGMRPRELIQARPNALVTKVSIFGEQGVFLRLVDGKNKASEREIPLSDGTREVLQVQRLREMLEWQEMNPRSPAGAITSFGTRFKKMTGGGTLYRMRHSWKDIAVNAGIDSELRKRLMGHKVPGVSAAYGSGIPLARGLDALLLIRDTIFGEKR
jgi:hypothetical protein